MGPHSRRPTEHWDRARAPRLGLAKWAKAAMLERIRDERPDAERIRTGNAFSNAPILALNGALGFVVISTQTEWQANVADARRALTR
jgi:mycothiol synthase